ncbi:MAG: DNA alkylation repair protein [Tannerellaceae bacterium]|nr:DNA alkylation repair protein [Tannerellaceae bacterium]
MEDIIRDMRGRFRRAMNGVASAGMRAQGIDYKLNFGVALPQIKEMALLYAKDAALAERLWNEDVRELKIMATLLQPYEAFTREQAERWAADIRYMEIAEQYCINLLQHLSFADTLAAGWIHREEGFVQVTGFLLYARLFSANFRLSSGEESVFLDTARRVMDKGISRPQRSAVIALKRYGRQSRQQADRALRSIAGYASCGSPEKQEFYNDIKFEFDYYF